MLWKLVASFIVVLCMSAPVNGGILRAAVNATAEVKHQVVGHLTCGVKRRMARRHTRRACRLARISELRCK